MQPALRTKTVAHEVHHPTAARVVAAAPHAAASHHAAAATPTSVRLPGTPAVCGNRAAGHSLSAGCDLHHSPTVYLTPPVPVAGNKKVGVSKDGRLCKLVPTTALTTCDTSSTPSNRSSS